MKFLTSNGLNENLHEFFNQIVKPYLKKAIEDLPFIGKKIIFENINNLSASSAIIDLPNIYDDNEIIIRLITNTDGTITEHTLLRSFNHGEVWEQIDNGPTSMVKKCNDGNYYIDGSGLTRYSSDLTTGTTVIRGTQWVSAIGILVNVITVRKLKNNKTIIIQAQIGNATPTEYGISLLNNDGSLTKLNSINNINNVYYDGGETIIVAEGGSTDSTTINFYKANIDSLNFELMTSVQKDSTERLRSIICASETGFRAIVAKTTTVNNVTTYSDYRDITLSSIMGNQIVGYSQTFEPFTTETVPVFTKLKNGRIIARVSQELYYSNDNGYSWTQIEHNIPTITSVLYELNNGIIVINSSSGIYVSYNQGESFKLKLEGDYKNINAIGNKIYLLDNSLNLSCVEF